MKDCLFCKIAEHKITTEVVYEDKEFLAFKDIEPKAKVHILLIPKRHFESIADLKEGDIGIAGRLIVTANKIARQQNIDLTGYRLVTNVGQDAGQVVKHLHIHILGGGKLGPIA